MAILKFNFPLWAPSPALLRQLRARQETPTSLSVSANGTSIAIPPSAYPSSSVPTTATILASSGQALSFLTPGTAVASPPIPQSSSSFYFPNTTLVSPIPLNTSSAASHTSSSNGTVNLLVNYRLAYSVYRNPFNVREDPDNFTHDFLRNVSRFRDPEYVFTFVTCGVAPSPNFGTIPYIDGMPSPNGYLPGHNTSYHYPTDLSEIAILAQGYFLAPTPGSYKLAATIDELRLLLPRRQPTSPTIPGTAQPPPTEPRPPAPPT